jgi:RNA polymerase sigma factor (sigma-70 family)
MAGVMAVSAAFGNMPAGVALPPQPQTRAALLLRPARNRLFGMDMAKDIDGFAQDAALLAAYARGDRDAARDLAQRIVPRILGYATRTLGDRGEAEDIAQEVMLRLWRAAPDWRAGEAQVSTWAYRVAINLCADRLRARKRRKSEALDEVAEPEDGAIAAVDGMIEADRQAALSRALADLPDRQRQAVVLRHIEGLANPEIAAILQVGVEAVESLIARGKRALTAALAARRTDLGYEEA